MFLLIDPQAGMEARFEFYESFGNIFHGAYDNDLDFTTGYRASAC